MLKHLLLFVFVLSSFFVRAGKPEKAFEALNRYDFFKARDLFLKLEKKQPALANYGLASIFIFEKNPYHDIDSARFRILNTEKYFDLLSEKEKLKLKKYKLDSLEIVIRKQQVADLAFEKTSKTDNTEKAWTKFLERYPFSSQFNLATEILHNIAYNNAKSVGTADALNAFLEKYPDSNQSKEALQIFYEKQFIEQTSDKSVKSYHLFIQNNPNSPFIKQAQDNLYEESTKSQTLTAYLNFARQNPQNPNADKAWRKVASLYLSEQYSSQKLVEFRLDYPDYPFLNELVQEIKISTETFYPVEINNLFGFINSTGELRIEAKFNWVGNFYEGLAAAGLNGKAGFINKFGNWVIKPIYDEVESFENGFAIVELNGNYGLIDRSGKTILQPTFSDIGTPSMGLVAVANQENLYGYFNVFGVQTIQFKYDFASNFVEPNFAVVSQNGKWGLINNTENTIIPLEFDWVDVPRKNLVRVKSDNNFGLFDTNGKLILQTIYSAIGEPQENRILVIKDNKLGYLNLQGAFVIELSEESFPSALTIANFKNGVALSKNAGKFGYIDTLGNKIYARVFEDIGDFNPPLIAVKKRGKWGFASQEVQLVIDYQFDSAESFRNSIAIVSKKNSYYFIDKNGKPINNQQYEKLSYLDETSILSKQNNLFGLLNFNAEPILANEFNEIMALDENMLLLKKNFRKAWFNRKLNKIVWADAGF